MALPALLSTDDLVKFRTRFCERFLQFGECNFGGKCQYSHNMTWRRRSPQKYLYEPRLCDNIVSYSAPDSGVRRQSVVNCHNGKNCKCAHSREEVLYHPLIYKTVLCEDANCAKYYCPFGHSMDELLATNESPEYIRSCLVDVCEPDENDADVVDDFDLLGDSEMVLMDGSSGLRMRKASGGTPSMMAAAPFGAHRLYLPVPGSPDWNASDLSSWVGISPAVRIETVVRTTSPVVPSELCRALVSRGDTAGLAAKKVISNQTLPNQYCLAKVMQVDSDSEGIITELNSIGKTEHRNILCVKKVHVGPIQGGHHQMLCLAVEQCSASLYQAIVDGYRNGTELSVRGLAKKMNPHTGTTTLTAIQRIADMIAGLQRLHFIGIAHLRLCPTNVLIDNEACFKIADFLGKSGLVKLMSSAAGGHGSSAIPYLADSVVVWHSPELIRFLQTVAKGDTAASTDAPNVVGKKSDIFSLANVIFYAMTGQHPFGSFATGDRLAAGGGSQQPLFTNGGAGQVVENILSDYVSNQHLLYNCPLVLDLCFRGLCLDPKDRLDIADLSRHPLFWDLDFIKSFFANLPTSPSVTQFLAYHLPWKRVMGGMLTPPSSLMDAVATLLAGDEYPDTVAGVVKFLQDTSALAATHFKSGAGLVSSFAPPSPAQMAPISGLWLKTLDTFPQILVRVWDASKLPSTLTPAMVEAFSRNHLHWMSLRGSATTCVSHHFVREYYSALNAAVFKNGPFPPNLSFPDESAGLADAAVAHTSSLAAKLSGANARSGGIGGINNYFLQDRKNSGISFTAKPPRLLAAAPCVQRSPPVTPVMSAAAWTPDTSGGLSGMKFVDPGIVKQMAAASAALSAVYENPELVTAITKGDATVAHNQLLATATIYSSLLNNEGGEPVVGGGGGRGGF